MANGNDMTCAKEVQQMNPPGKMCDYNRCLRMQKIVDAGCHGRNWQPGQPYGLDNPDGSICYCCCSCFAKDTPIEVSAGNFKLVQDIKTSETVRAAYKSGAGWIWKDTVVDFVTNVNNSTPEDTLAFMVTLYYDNGAGGQTFLCVTEDHLFLMPDGKMIPASALNTNDLLVRADGSTTKIIAIISGQKKGGVYQLATGAPIQSADGHLLNSNGIISADFALQAGYISAQMSVKKLVADLSARPRVGTAAHDKKYMNTATKKILGDPTLWPEGFKATIKTQLFNVPVDAMSFLTKGQAESIMKNPLADKRPFDSNFGIEMGNYLFRLFKSFYPNPNYVIDWVNEVPNAYAFNSYGSDYVLLTGGLIRQYAMNQEGLSLVICYCLASLYGYEGKPEGAGISCVGIADYASILVYFGNVYRGNNYGPNYRSALAQYETLFGYSTASGPVNKCKNPGLTCRLDTIRAAAMGEEVPACADPDRNYFEVLSAYSKKGTGKVEVTFSKNVNVSSASSVINYTFEPFEQVLNAGMKTGSKNVVMLDAALFENTDYKLTVTEVISSTGEELVNNTVYLKLSDGAQKAGTPKKKASK